MLKLKPTLWQFGWFCCFLCYFVKFVAGNFFFDLTYYFWSFITSHSYVIVCFKCDSQRRKNKRPLFGNKISIGFWCFLEFPCFTVTMPVMANFICCKALWVLTHSVLRLFCNCAFSVFYFVGFPSKRLLPRCLFYEKLRRMETLQFRRHVARRSTSRKPDAERHSRHARTGAERGIGFRRNDAVDVCGTELQRARRAGIVPLFDLLSDQLGSAAEKYRVHFDVHYSLELCFLSAVQDNWLSSANPLASWGWYLAS